MSRSDDLFNIRYGMRYGLRAARFYGRASSVLMFFEIISGSSAYAAWLANYPTIASSAALITALAAGINLTFSPTEKHIRCKIMREKFAQLNARESALNDNQLSESIGNLYAEDAIEIEALRMPAYLDTCMEMGLHPEDSSLTFSQRTMAILS